MLDLLTQHKEILLQILKIGALLIIGIAVIVWLSKLVRKAASKQFSPQQGMVLSKIILYGGLTILILSTLKELGYEISALLGAAGIAGVAIGFASQTSMSNIISGIFLIAEKPFEIGDVITVENTTGTVLSIDFLSIKLRTFDNKFVRIPNETIIKTQVTNITRFPIRRVDISVGVAYKENIGKVRDLLLEIAHNEPLCLNDPEPLVVVSGFGSSSVDLLLLAWAVKTDWLKLKNSLMEKIKEKFDENGIEIPFPHVSLYSGSATDPFPVKIMEIKNEVKSSQ